MRTFLISAVAAAATMALATPATAQYRGYDHRGGYDQRDRDDDDDRRGGWGDRDDDRRGGWGNNNQHNVNRQAVFQLMRELDRAEAQIQRGVQRGNISQREAMGLRREAANIRMRLQRASRNGLNQREYYELRQRVNHLEQRVRYERRDRDNRRW